MLPQHKTTGKCISSLAQEKKKEKKAIRLPLFGTSDTLLKSGLHFVLM